MSDELRARDRRRAPRRAVPLAEPLALEICAAVRILDISRRGALLAGPLQASPGASVSLRTLLDSAPVMFPLEIVWCHGQGVTGPASKVGGEFTTLDSEARQRLDSFLSRVT